LSILIAGLVGAVLSCAGTLVLHTKAASAFASVEVEVHSLEAKLKALETKIESIIQGLEKKL
jgi:hypothetical protein